MCTSSSVPKRISRAVMFPPLAPWVVVVTPNIKAGMTTTMTHQMMLLILLPALHPNLDPAGEERRLLLIGEWVSLNKESEERVGNPL